VQPIAVSPKRRTLGGVVAHITRPRQVPILAGARSGADDAAPPQTVAVLAPFRWPDHPRTIYAGADLVAVGVVKTPMPRCGIG
jgi:hypothetical protein